MTIHSDAYKEAERFAMEDQRVIELVGKITKVRFCFWDGFEFASAGSGGEASFVLDVTGDNRKAVMDIRLYRAAGQWYEDEVYVRFHGENRLHAIYPTYPHKQDRAITR